MFFELTEITAHPVDKNRGLVDPHGGHQFFQSARAVGEVEESMFLIDPLNLNCLCAANFACARPKLGCARPNFACVRPKFACQGAEFFGCEIGTR